MDDIENAVFPFEAAKSRKLNAVQGAIPTKVTPRKIVRPLLIVFFIAGVSAAGWGTWSLIGTTANVTDDQSIADLDGFESAPAFNGNETNNAPAMAGLGEASSLAPPNASDFKLPIDDSTIQPGDSADVWLTGTIEETEPTKPNQAPVRISGSSTETSTLR